ncbi:MAG: glycogen synthase [Sandaracinaceae bacterium]
MRLLFVTPEIAPYSSATPTAARCGGLPKALRGRGHEVTVVSPLYGSIDANARGLGRRLRKIEGRADGESFSFALYDTRTAAGVTLLFLAQEELFAKATERAVLEPSRDSARAFEGFARAVVDLIRQDDDGFDRVVCHDWATALVPTLAKEAGLTLSTVLEISDVRATGRAGSAIESTLGLTHGFLEAGIRDATRITTVSPSYAVQIAEDPALGPLLTARGRDVSGIVGGVDVARWNPATDAHLFTRFDPMGLAGKLRCKSALQRAHGMPTTNEVPLIAVIGRLDRSEGLDALARITGRLLRNDVQVHVVGDGPPDAELVGVLNEHAERWPDRLSVVADADERAQHRALSAADVVLVPPRQSPAGSLALVAQRYGALPVAARRGAVTDQIVDCDASLRTGNGFLFDDAAGEAGDDAMLAALQRAVGAYADRRAFERLRATALAADHGWDRAAYLYERLYESMG